MALTVLHAITKASLTLGLIVNAAALVCYESLENDEIKLGNNTNWPLCAGSITMGGSGHRFYGIDDTSDVFIRSYGDILGEINSNRLHRIHHVCVFEEYNILGQEMIFRCMCKSDGCNSPRTMPYLRNIDRKPLPQFKRHSHRRRH